MTPLEIFRLTTAHDEHDEYLFYMGFCESLERDVRAALSVAEQQSLRDYFGMTPGTSVAMEGPENPEQPDFSGYFADMQIPAGAFINEIGVLNTPGSVAHFTSYTSPLRNAANLDDLERFTYPGVHGFSEARLAEEVRSAHDRGDFTVLWVGHMYETSWQIRGYTEFLMDLMDRPEWCEYILDRIKERNLLNATAAARAGVDMLRTGDDVANQNTLMFSADTWRRIFKPRWAQVYAAARAIKPDIEIWYHSDGNITQIVPDLIEIGVTILNPVQPECLDLTALKRAYGDKLVFDGTVGTQSTMPWGTPEEVRGVVRSRARDIGYDGALIFSPTHMLEPEVPVANVVAFADEVKRLPDRR